MQPSSRLLANCACDCAHVCWLTVLVTVLSCFGVLPRCGLCLCGLCLCACISVLVSLCLYFCACISVLVSLCLYLCACVSVLVPLYLYLCTCTSGSDVSVVEGALWCLCAVSLHAENGPHLLAVAPLIVAALETHGAVSHVIGGIGLTVLCPLAEKPENQASNATV